MQQYLLARQKLESKSLLLFRMGDFYEAFFDDAKIIAKELEITLTGRPEQNYPEGRIPMAGVPAKAVKAYIQKLLEKNYRIYMAEQMQDPKSCKGLVPREIVKVYTPGTINDLDFIDNYKNNFILSLYPSKDNLFGLAYADISTGEFYVTELSIDNLYSELARINPSELLLPAKKSTIKTGNIVAELEPIYDLKYNYTLFDKQNFDLDLARQNLSSVFNLNSVEKFFDISLNGTLKGLALIAAGALIEYFKETLNFEFANSAYKNFEIIKTYTISDSLILDQNTKRNLELISGTSSLFESIDRTASRMGRRLLQSWMEKPLINIQEINSRLDSIEELKENSELASKLHDKLKEIYDIPRLSTRLASTLIMPRELNQLKNSLLASLEISNLLCKSKQFKHLHQIPNEIKILINTVENALKEDLPITVTEGDLIKPAYNQELDEYISLVNDSETWLKNFEETEREKTAIKTLKVGFNKIHGYFIECSRLNSSKLTENYKITQTMVNTVRAVNPELKDFEEKITYASTRRNALEYKLYSELKIELSALAPIIKTWALYLAELDALLSLAILANQHSYTRPILDNSNQLKINSGRHPVIEQKLKLGQFVPNDIDLDDSNSIIILTGPNMAGKSTYMRQNALIILLAQMGSFVPADFAYLGIVDRIFTRIGASDDLASGQSTFMLEMTETAAILNSMTDKSFIVLDEIGRGTSTYDGVSIAWAILEFIAKSSKARTIFATHYHELSVLDQNFSKISNYQVSISESSNSSIEFLHKVIPGSASKSYGIEVARLAGLPKEILNKARLINQQLASSRPRSFGKSANSSQIQIEKLPLFESN